MISMRAAFSRAAGDPPLISSAFGGGRVSDKTAHKTSDGDGAQAPSPSRSMGDRLQRPAGARRAPARQFPLVSDWSNDAAAGNRLGGVIVAITVLFVTLDCSTGSASVGVIVLIFSRSSFVRSPRTP